jgi:hypothetical protein
VIDAIKFLWMAYGAYKLANRNGGKTAYASVCYRGIPKVCCYVATGREAWRVSRIAIEEFVLPS